jgi:LPXTG-motif cell wall-anchored protein
MLLVLVVASTGLFALPVAAEPASPGPVAPTAAVRPVPAAVHVSITDAGYVPPTSTVAMNQTVVFSNDATTPQSVTAGDATFDSGPIPVGGAYAIALGAPGTFSFSSPTNAALTGQIVVGLLDLPGDPTAPVHGTLPVIKIPPVLDFDDHPTLGIRASRTRAMVGFGDTATISEANDALAQANVTVIGTVPGLDGVLVQTTDDGPGAFGPVDAAIALLRAHPAVDAAFHDLQVGLDTLPAPPEDVMQNAPQSWRWDDPRLSPPPPGPVATTGNWGLESSRFPEAWNLLDQVRSRSAPVQTAVFDGGVTAHPDLSVGEVTFCELVVLCTGNDEDTQTHGTHVAGTVGALWNNTRPPAGNRSIGVSGANPVAHVSSVPQGGLFPDPVNGSSPAGASITSGYAIWTAMLDEKGPDKKLPDLRAINYSMRNVTFSESGGALSWPTIWAGKRCGPGYDDDAAPSGPCTPNTEDGFLREIDNQGHFARRVAVFASRRNVLIAASAGNYSGTMCEDGSTVTIPVGGRSESAGATCPSGFMFSHLDTRRVYPFGWADQNWSGSDANPILMVGAVDASNGRSAFSMINGDVSAPGTDILSTVPSSADPTRYKRLSGTSMATPHVTALAGYLLAYDPSLTAGQVRDLIIRSARADTPENVGPRIDAVAAFHLLPNTVRDLADLSDPSADGDRRVIRAPGAPDVSDNVMGATINGENLHTSPDGHVDMRDFRRLRDAWLQLCVTGPPGAANCPAASTITLDGAANHVKKDLNFDGCVFPADAGCTPPEQHYARFDLNGDGFVDPLRQASVTLPGGVTGNLSDLDMMARSFEPSGGWTGADLPRLLRSGDLEIHADAMFSAGADTVDVSVKYGTDGKVVTGTLERKRGTLIVTVPTDDPGTQIEVSSKATVGPATLESALVLTQLGHGQDKRVDLCVPHIETTAEDPALWSGGKDTTKVHATYLRCDGEPVEAEHVDFHVEKEDGSAAEATLSAPADDTDASGRATVELTAGADPEKDVVTAELTIDGAPGTPPQVISSKLPIAVDNGPRLLYRWEQVTDEWHNVVHDLDIDQNPVTTAEDGTAPVTVERAGQLQPLPGADDHAAGVAVTEDVGPDAVSFAAVSSDGTESAGTLVIPVGDRHVQDVKLTDTLPADLFNADGSPRDIIRLANTNMDVRDDQVIVHDIADVSAVRYSVDTDPTGSCSQRACFSLARWNQLGLVEREQGSAFAYADDLSRPLSFDRKSDGTWSTYQWCGAPASYSFPPEDYVDPEKFQIGSATSRFRFVATITTDPAVTAGSLTLPATDCTTDARPPIAAIARDFVTAKEGQIVRFLDASSDPNSDIVAWHWDFGDGTTSDEQLVDHRYEDNGSYRVTLKVTDRAGLSDTHSIVADVVNVDPSVSGDAVTVPAGQAVATTVRLFDPGERDQQSLQVDLSWNEAGMPVYPTQIAPAGSVPWNLGLLPDGVHTLTITVRDKDGGSATTTVGIVVGSDGGTVEPDVDIETEAAPGCDFGVKLDLGEVDLVDRVSAYRAQNQRARVYPSPTLTAAAEAHAAWLRDNGLLQHVGVGGSDPLKRAQDAGYPGAAVGEALDLGGRTAPDVLVGWQVADADDATLLDARWRAVGVAHIDTSRGPLWVAEYGDGIDCPKLPPDLSSSIAGTAPPAAERRSRPAPADAAASEPAVGGPAGGAAPMFTPVRTTGPDERPVSAGARVSGDAPGVTSVGTDEPSAPTAQPAATSAPPAAPGGVAAAGASGAVPLVAFTIDDATPTTGATVAVHNGSVGAATLDTGDGRAPFVLGTDASAPLVYLDPGTFNARLAIGGSTPVEATMPVVVGGVGRAPAVVYTGPAGAAVGARAALSATVTTGGVPVGNRAVRFTIDGRSLDAVTGADGVARAELVVDLVPASYGLTVDVPALPGGAGASTIAPFAVTANGVPVVDLRGPYDVLINDAITPDLSATFDPDGQPLAGAAWDLDGDGAFDDLQGFGPIDAAVVSSAICGGQCVPGVDKTIALRVTDVAGGVAEGSATVRFARDFSISVTPGSATVNPGGSISFVVGVVSGSGFSDPVALSTPGLPAGVTASFQPATVTPTGSSVLTLTAAPDAAAFDTPFTVRGVSGAVTHDAASTIDVEFGLIPACYATITVRVTDDVTGVPVVGATFSGYDAVTDADGVHVFTEVPVSSNNAPRAVGYTVNHPDYWVAIANGVAACGAPTAIDLKVTRKKAGVVTGHTVIGVPDPADHSAGRAVTPSAAPLPNAGVTLRGSTTYSTTSEADGRFVFPQVLMQPRTNAAEIAFLSSQPAGYWIGVQQVTIPPDTTSDFTLAMVPKCTTTADVRVTDETTHLPIPGLRVQIFTPDDAPTATTGPDGRALVTPVVLGVNNSSVDRQVFVTGTFGGQNVNTSGSIRLHDCGITAVADITVHLPVERRASVTGRVTESGTGLPLANTRIDTAYGAATTDGNGAYHLDDLLIGYDAQTTVNATVIATPPTDDHLGASATAQLHDGETAVQDFALEVHRFAAADVVVVDALTGEPLAGVTVLGDDSKSGQTDGLGRTTLTRIATQNQPRRYQVTGMLPGYHQQSVVVTVNPGQTTPVEVRLVRECASATVTGRVLNAATGEVLPDATVSRSSDGQFVFTDANGRFTHTGIRLVNNAPATVTFRASKVGFVSAERTVTVFCGAHITLDFGVPDTGTATLSGVVTELATGNPVVGATVGTEWGAVATTATDGSYSFTGVPLGGEPTEKTWSIDVLAPPGSGLGDATKPVTVHKDQASTLDFALTAPTNRRPVAEDRALALAPGDSSAQVALIGSDPDGDALTYRVFNPIGGSVGPPSADGLVTFDLAPGATTAGFSYVVSDGHLDSAVATVTITRAATTTTTTSTTSTTSTSTTTTVPTSTTTSTSTSTSTTTSSSTTTMPTSTTSTTTTVPTSTTTMPPTSTTVTTTAPTTTTIAPTTTVPSSSTTSTTAPPTTSTSTSSTSVLQTSTTSSSSTTTTTTAGSLDGPTTTSPPPSSSTTTPPTATAGAGVGASGAASSGADPANVNPAAANATGQLPTTGSSPRFAFALALMLLAVGGALLVVRRRHAA